MMKGCGRVEGMPWSKHRHRHMHNRSKPPTPLPIDCNATTWGCCPDGVTKAESQTDDCLPKIVDTDGEEVDQWEMGTYCPNKENSKTRSCYDSGKRCEYTEDCRLNIEADPHKGLGCIAELEPSSGDTIRTKCRYCGFGGYPDCPQKK